MTARTTEEETYSNLYLPDEIWDCIFKFFDGDDDTLKSLSVVSKEFLSIYNRLRFSLTITDQTTPFLSSLFHRFCNLTSLKLVLLSERDDNDVNELLTLISTLPNLSSIKSLSFSNGYNNIPADGLRALSKKMINLTSFTCSGIKHIHKKHLFIIADCFPLLEELNLKTSNNFYILLIKDDHQKDQRLALPKLRKINLSGTLFNRQYIVDLCKNCELLQEIIVIDQFSLRKRTLKRQLRFPSEKVLWQVRPAKKNNQSYLRKQYR